MEGASPDLSQSKVPRGRKLELPRRLHQTTSLPAHFALGGIISFRGNQHVRQGQTAGGSDWQAARASAESRWRIERATAPGQSGHYYG